jgi:UDP-glucose:(heptosyl)LPS alpha-1,3-glucosyltransferase
MRGPQFLRLERYDRFTKEWIEKNQPDLIFGMERNRIQTHLRAGNGVHAAYLQARGWLKRTLAFFSPFHAKILQLEQAAFSYSGLQKIFVNSHMVQREVESYYNVDPEKICVIHNGVEWEEMGSAFAKWPEEKQPIDSSLTHFLFVGNGYGRKGLTPLLLALAQMKERAFHLSVVGKESRLSYYQALTIKYNLAKNVTFFGPQINLTPFYQRADVLLIPSLYDPFANVTVEGLAMGLFVISSKFNGGHEILNKENGWVIPDLHDPHSFASLLTSALERRKTDFSAQKIRDSVQSLDFSLQMRSLLDQIL